MQVDLSLVFILTAVAVTIACGCLALKQRSATAVVNSGGQVDVACQPSVRTLSDVAAADAFLWEHWVQSPVLMDQPGPDANQVSKHRFTVPVRAA